MPDLGAEVIQFPTIDIKPLEDYSSVDAAVRNLGAYDWLIFTSANGVKCFWERLEAQGLDARALYGLQVAAIGRPRHRPCAPTASRPTSCPKPTLRKASPKGLSDWAWTARKSSCPAPREAREVLPEELRKAGAQVDVLPVYETVPGRRSP